MKSIFPEILLPLVCHLQQLVETYTPIDWQMNELVAGFPCETFCRKGLLVGPLSYSGRYVQIMDNVGGIKTQAKFIPQHDIPLSPFI